MDIYTALHRDHEEVQKLLERLVAVTKLDQDTSALLARISELLIPHARAEEEVFYNSIRRLDPGNDEAMHGFREHVEAETLLRALQGMAMVGIEWTAAAKKLRDAIGHHIREEETKIFSIARKLFDQEEARQLATAFEAAKAESTDDGALSNMAHMVSNMMPPRLRGESGAHHRT